MCNTEITNNGTEVYTSRLFSLTDEYMEQKLDGKEDNIPKQFRDLIFYLADRIEKPDNDDIAALDRLFDAYVRLCTRYGKLPTLECFSWLAGIDRNTFTDWSKGRYRTNSPEHGSTVKRWLNVCRGFAIDELSNSRFANPNLIFTAKAAYGMRETSPIPAIETETRQVLPADAPIDLLKFKESEV